MYDVPETPLDDILDAAATEVALEEQAEADARQAKIEEDAAPLRERLLAAAGEVLVAKLGELRATTTSGAHGGTIKPALVFTVDGIEFLLAHQPGNNPPSWWLHARTRNNTYGAHDKWIPDIPATFGEALVREIARTRSRVRKERAWQDEMEQKRQSDPIFMPPDAQHIFSTPPSCGVEIRLPDGGVILGKTLGTVGSVMSPYHPLKVRDRHGKTVLVELTGAVIELLSPFDYALRTADDIDFDTDLSAENHELERRIEADLRRRMDAGEHI